MRISDWSSDVCSSDLHHRTAQSEHGDPVRIDAGRAAGPGAGRGGGMDGAFARLPRGAAGAGRLAAPARQPDPLMAGAGGMNDTILKFGYPATLIREYEHWVVLLRPAQLTLGSLDRKSTRLNSSH